MDWNFELPLDSLLGADTVQKRMESDGHNRNEVAETMAKAARRWYQQDDVEADAS